MVQYTELQKKISLIILYEPKTAEELAKQLNISYNQLMKELKELLKLNVIEKYGFPTKYKLKDQISQELRRRKKIQETDHNKIRLRAIIEGKSLKKESVEKLLNQIETSLKKENDFQVYDVKHEKPIKNGEYYTSFIEINFSLRDFASITKFLYFYTPTSIEVIKPPKFEITAAEFQEGLITMVDMIHGFSDYILKQMNKEELIEFTKKLYNKK